jgi:hypothetical protein
MPLGGGAYDTGSGAYIGLGGYVLTAEHVVRGHRTGYVNFSDGAGRIAHVIAADRVGDVALLKIKPHPTIEGMKIADSKPAIGSLLYFAGHGGYPTRGYSTGWGTVVQAEQHTTIRWSNHRPRQGDSGGPVWNGTDGVVSVVSGYSPDHTATGCGQGRLRAFLRNILPGRRKAQQRPPVIAQPPLIEIPGTPRPDQPNPAPPASQDVELLRTEIERLKKMMDELVRKSGPAGDKGPRGDKGPVGGSGKSWSPTASDFDRWSAEIQKRIRVPVSFDVIEVGPKEQPFFER